MMGHRARGSRSVVAVLLVAALTTAGLVTSAAGSGAARVNAASWNSRVPATAISATVYVSAVNCSAVARGTYAGQESGIELSGTYRASFETARPADFAGVYAYCDGHKPKYIAEFITANLKLGRLTVTPARVTGTRSERLKVAPGDPLKLSIINTGAGLTLSIRNVNTAKHASISAAGLGRASGWSAGTLPIFASSSGGPELRGSLGIVEEYSPTGGPATIPGPAAFPPVVFNSLLVDHSSPKPSRAGVFASKWFGGSGKPVAEVTSPHRGNFIAARVRLKKPVLHKKFDIAHVSGTVLVKVPGTDSYERLTSVSQVPNDSSIDVSDGHVQVTLGLPHGKSETGVFSDGQFKLHQETNGNAVLTLAGDSGSVCNRADTGGASAGAARAVAHTAKTKTKKKVQSLWSNAHGNFTTKGSAGAAAVLGTKWFTENECGGTYFRVVRDKIKVTAYYPKPHTVIVTQGHSYFAAGPVAPAPVPAIHIAPVSPTNGRYNVQISGTYSITVVTASRPAYVNAAVAPQQPSGGNVPFFADGSVGGTPRWTIQFHITPDLGHFQNWNVGVEIAGKLYVVPLRVS
jgi:hypothetical protein